VEVECSVSERTTEEVILDTRYTIPWRDNTIIGSSSPRTQMPLYRRAALAAPDIGMRSKQATLRSVLLVSK
jgi:hypothetical protein